MKKKNIQLFSAYYFVCYLIFAIGGVQRIPYLIKIGYSSSERSLILSAIALLSIIGQMTFAYISDKHNILKKIVLSIVTIFTVFTFFIYNFEQKLFIYHFIFVVMSGSLQNIIADLNDSWIMQSGSDIRSKLSFIKMFQSIGYSLGAIVGSLIITHLGYGKIASVVAFLGVLALIIISFIDNPKVVTGHSIISMSDIVTLIKSKSYVLSIILFLAFFSITQIHAISLAEKILYLGGNESHVAYRVIVGVGLEAIAYLFCDKIYVKYGPYVMLYISATFYIIMYSLFIISSTPQIMVVFAALQLFTAPFYVVAMKHIVFKLSPSNLKTSGQLFLSAILMGISGTLTPLLVGFLRDSYGINAPLFAAIGFASFAILMTIITKISIEKDNPHYE